MPRHAPRLALLLLASFPSGRATAQSCAVGPPSALGQVTVLSTTCTRGTTTASSCYTLQIACTSIPTLDVDLEIHEPPIGVALRGTVLLGMGGAGVGFYGDRAGGPELFQLLTSNGFRVVDRSWRRSWFGDGFGVRRQSCRYATLLDWVHDNLHTTGIFAASGNSSGSSEVGYALTTWGADAILDVAIPTGGPSMSRIDYLCLPSAFWAASCPGFVPTGPWECSPFDCDLSPESRACLACSASATPMDLELDSVLHPQAVLSFPTTRVHQILGAQDCGISVPSGYLFHAAVTSEKVIEVVPGTPHWVPTTQVGREAMLRALLGGGACGAKPATLLATTWPVLGGPSSFAVRGPAWASYGIYWSLGEGLFELPPLGWGFIAPPVKRLAMGTLDEAGGASFTLPVPSNASLVGLNLYLQALVDGCLTNRSWVRIDP